MLGLIIGIVFGVGDFLLLVAFISSITKKQKPSVFFGILFAFAPFLILFPVGFFLTEQLLWAAGGFVGSLIILALTKFIIETTKDRRNDTK